MFSEHVISMRPTKLSLTGSKETWASGDTFFAEAAVQIGLADGPVISISELIYELNAINQSQTQSGDSQMAKQIVLKDELERARLAAGAAEDSTPEQKTSEVTEEPAVDPSLQAGGEEDDTPDPAPVANGLLLSGFDHPDRDLAVVIAHRHHVAIIAGAEVVALWKPLPHQALAGKRVPDGHRPIT